MSYIILYKLIITCFWTNKFKQGNKWTFSYFEKHIHLYISVPKAVNTQAFIILLPRKNSNCISNAQKKKTRNRSTQKSHFDGDYCRREINQKFALLSHHRWVGISVWLSSSLSVNTANWASGKIVRWVASDCRVLHSPGAPAGSFFCRAWTKFCKRIEQIFYKHLMALSSCKTKQTYTKIIKDYISLNGLN